MSGQETIASRFVKLNQIILGKSNLNLPTQYLAHRDGLLDVLFALYEECNVDYMRRDKQIAAFVDTYKGLMIELKSLRVNVKDFEVKKIIGRGHFGEVQVVREKATGDVYAMKTLRKENTLSQQNIAFYKEERDIMSKSTSPWLTKLQYAFQDSQNIYLVMEFHPGGDMLSLLEKYDNVLPEEMIQFYLAELVLAIHGLHTMGYVHRDIKPDNILIDRTGHIKLADFGSASKLNPHKQVTSCMPVGTPDYVAPEVLTAMNSGPASSRSYGVECDWWSLGIVTYEMVFGSTPFADDKVLITYNNIMNFKNSLHFPPDAEEVSKDLISLIKDLLQDASTRLGFDQLVVHPLFTDIDWNNIRHTAPPYVPTVTSVDDTSNFDEFEPENRPYIGDLKGKREFSGKNLPFVGFTFTAPFQVNFERLSSYSDNSIMSPSSSFCEPDSVPKKKETVALERKISQLSTSETSLKTDIDKLKNNLEMKNKEVDKIKNEKIVLEKMTEELRAEIQQVRQLLTYEREHRVITEHKATQLIRCMKTKHRQDTLRLQAKSFEFNKGAEEKSTLEQQLEEALSKIDEFAQERADLLEDLEATKHTLLEVQRKLNEKEMNFSALSLNETDKSLTLSKSQNCSSLESDFVSEAVDYKRLILKLERKNLELEKDLELVNAEKIKKEVSNTALQKTISELKNKIEELEKTITDSMEINSNNEKEINFSAVSIDETDKSLSLNKSQNCSTLESNLGSEAKRLIFKLEKKNLELERDLEHVSAEKIKKDVSNTALQKKISELENKIEQLEKNITDLIQRNSKNENKIEVNLSCQEFQEKNAANSSHDTITEETSGFSDDAISVHEEALSQSIDVPSQNSESFEPSPMKKTASDEAHSLKKHPVFEDESDLKQENQLLKNQIDILNAEIIKLKSDIKNLEHSNTEVKNQLREKEKDLSEAKIDLRISSRKEQQAESLTSTLRERNKELREKIKSLEGDLNEKINAENELKQRLNNLESELSEKVHEVDEKQKLLEIEKVKHEEQIKAMKYTCEISKDVSQKFAKSQDHYEEIVKQNMDLIKEKEEKNQAYSQLLNDIKTLKKELAQKKSECAKFEKLNGILKNTYVEMEEQLKELEMIIDIKEKAIQDLKDLLADLRSKNKSLENDLKETKAYLKKTENKNEELMKHIQELTSELDSNHYIAETEMQDVQDQLAHYKRITSELEAQNSVLQKNLTLQNLDCKNYSAKILSLESQLCEIKEEAARHITQISSLKSSNLKLTQALEDAIEDNKEARQENENFQNELESLKITHHYEKVKMQETISQQTKLIDFLQTKAESMEKRKKPHLSRFFGKKENTADIAAQYKDAEKSLETEKSRCRRLQDQLSQARAEVVALQKELHSSKNSNINVEVPASPSSRAMHNVITQSPSGDFMNEFSKPPGMKHKIPHRFENILCMRSTKCCACLDSLHFGRLVAKCQECLVVCHQTCATSLPNTCGLPSGFMQHFRKMTVKSGSSSDTVENCEKLYEGWVKTPKSNKLGWDRRYLRLVDYQLCLFETAEVDDPHKAVIKLDVRPKFGKIVVTSAVSATELTSAASSDLPYVLKLEYFPHTTCWPQRCLYIMTSNFSDKQKWVSTLEDLAEESNTEVESSPKNKLVGKAVWTLKGDKLIDPLCTYILDDNIILLGAMDGLYVLKIVNKFSCSLKLKIDGLQNIYQIACLKSIGLMVFIQGNEQRIAIALLSSLQSAVQKIGSSSLITRPLSDITDCHLFSVDPYHDEQPYLCVATLKSIILFQWDTVLKIFCPKKEFETKEPCSCIHFTSKTVIYGTDSFYELNLSDLSVKNFLDSKDASLAGIIYGASQFRSFPIAIFQVSSVGESTEYLMCFHEMGVFVNDHGQRTRVNDMKWSRLPLSFAYQMPYLFITHFNSVEVIEIPPRNAIEPGLQSVTLIQNPQCLGPAHLEQSIYLSSYHDQIIELILVDGQSLGSTEFNLQHTDGGSTESYSTSSSSKESTAESDGLDFSFTTSIDQSLADVSVDQMSIFSRTSSASDSVSSQN